MKKQKNSRVGCPPRPWFIYPADLEQLWLVIPGCLFLCILKQGIALAILVAIWWLVSKSVDAQKSWEHICDTNMELMYVSKEYIKNSNYVKVEGEYIYMTEEERKDILEYLEKKEKEEKEVEYKTETILKEILIELNICNILEYCTHMHNYFIGKLKCEDSIIDKFNNNQSFKKLLDDSICDYVRDFKNGCTREIDRWEEYYKENYRALFKNNFAKKLFPYIYANVYKKGKVHVDVVYNMDLFIYPYKILDDIIFDNDGNIMYKNNNIREYLNEQINSNYLTKKGYNEYEKRYYESYGIHWR